MEDSLYTVLQKKAGKHSIVRDACGSGVELAYWALGPTCECGPGFSIFIFYYHTGTYIYEGILSTKILCNGNLKTFHRVI
jgi:hypothetical protein